MTGDDLNIDVDPMLFYALVIEDQIAIMDAMLGPEMGDMGAIAGFGEGVADICRRQIEQAQATLDTLIAEDTTWTDSFGTWCEMTEEPIGTDPEDGDYFHCTVHGKDVLGDAYICEGYAPPPYTGDH